jgi:hypothetical protein
MKKIYFITQYRHLSAMLNFKAFWLTLVLIVLVGVQGWGTTYYSKLTGNANSLATWGTAADGTGTAPTNFTTTGDIFNLRSVSSLTTNGNWLIGATGNGNTWVLNVTGTLTVSNTITLQARTTGTESTTTCNVNGTTGIIVFTGNGQIVGNSNAIKKSIFNLNTGSSLVTNNTNGIIGASASINNSNLTVTLNAGANYEFNGAAQATTGLPATVNNLILSGSDAKTLGTVAVNGTLSMEGTATTAGTAPTYGSAATLQYKGSAAQTVGSEFPATFSGTGGVIINNTSGVTLSSGSKTIGSGSKFTIKDGSSFKVNNGNTLTFTTGATANVERSIPSANWHLISSPVSGLSPHAFASLAGNNIKPGTGDYDMAPYIEATDEWTPYVTSSHTTAMPAASGYSVRRTAAGTVTFSGTGIYTGPQTVGITCGATTNGWNCIGNPYTSAINAATFLTANTAAIDDNYE